MTELQFHPNYKSAPSKLCRQCIHAHYILGGPDKYECHHPSNITGASPVTGNVTTEFSALEMRLNESKCGWEAALFDQRAVPENWYGKCAPDAFIDKKESPQDRLTRLRDRASRSVTSKSLKQVTVDDL